MLKIRNWKLALLAALFIGLFIRLGIWQLSRAEEKKILLNTYAKRIQLPPLILPLKNAASDLRFYRINLTGQFDNARTLLLDNKIVDSKVGYEVYTLFHADGLSKPILIDRGFIPMKTNRRSLPAIPIIKGHIHLTGMLNQPPKYFTFGKMAYTMTQPLLIEYVNLAEIASLFHQPLFDYVLTMPTVANGAPQVNWQIITMPPEKHRGYALQWFAFALTLLIIFVALNRPQKKNR